LVIKNKISFGIIRRERRQPEAKGIRIARSKLAIDDITNL
jgi:hypothetical protein